VSAISSAYPATPATPTESTMPHGAVCRGSEVSSAMWADASKREVHYAVCKDRRTLLWFANQRAIEYHPALVRTEHPDKVTHLVLDLDPPDAEAFGTAVRVAHLVRRVLADAGLEGAVKTSGAKGVHIFVPIDTDATMEDAAAATRAIAARTERLDPEIATTAFMKEDRGGKVFVDSTRSGGATVIAAYSPRVRPGATSPRPESPRPPCPPPSRRPS